MTSLDAYKMQRLKTTIFSLLSQSLLTKKKKDVEILEYLCILFSINLYNIY